MANSSTGRLGELDLDGAPDGFIAKISKTEVDPTTGSGTIVFPNARKGVLYFAQAECPDNDCWDYGAGPIGPDGSGATLSSGAFAGFTTGALVLKPPGYPAWRLVGSNKISFVPLADGDVLAAMADDVRGDNTGVMPVTVFEMEGSGPANGRLDILDDISLSGSGGSLPAASPAPGVVRFQISVPNTGIINRVESVDLIGLSHSYANDLTITLISPANTRVTLVDRAGAGTEDADSDYDGDYSFDGVAETYMVFAGGTATPGTYRSASELFSLAGERSEGVWTLEIRDHAQEDIGILTSWQINLTLAETNQGVFPEPTPVFIPETAIFSSLITASKTITSSGTISWPTTMPSNYVFFNVTVADIGILTRFVSVRLMDFNHVQAGDIQAVVQSPSGTKVTIFHRPGSTSGSTGNTGEFAFGRYIFTEDSSTTLPDAAIITPGTYTRDPGDWPGLPNDQNVPVGTFADFVGESITGTWKVYIFDWAPGFNGSMAYAQIVLEWDPDTV